MKKTLNTVLTAALLLFIAVRYGDLIYMNLRPADPILPGWEEYDQERFNARQKAGAPMLVEIYASWCPTCKAQHAAFEALIDRGQHPALHAVRVDYDRDQAFRESLGIDHTGVLILFEGNREIARRAGLTTPEALLTFLAQHGYGPTP